MSQVSADERLRHARLIIANAFLGPRLPQLPLGEITLRPHQTRAVTRLLPLLRRDRGALLADATGLGKTFVALAVAREFQQVLVITPASLRASWAQSLARTALQARVVSMEWLSRRGNDLGDMSQHDLVVIDEAHHFRTPGSRRYAAAAELCRRTPVLLLSATPLQNRSRDLSALLALFLGSVAWSMTDAERARLIVRRDDSAAGVILPALDGPHWLSPSVDDDWLDALLALPSPTPGSDEGDGGALVVYSLVRQWASSRAALLAGLRHRLARASAMGAALESGRRPSRRELAAWHFADGALQLAFPELLAVGTPVVPSRLAELRRAVRVHEQGISDLLTAVRGTSNPDHARAEMLRDVRRAHAGARILAFSQFAETVHALGGLLRRDGGVAELTARGARVAGGRISRRDVLAQFAPTEGRSVSAAERIDMLIATDVLSEGLDLQQASVVVHLDLPWNPARLEQRVGRVRRLGSPHARVSVYVCAPPAAAERLLRVGQRLRHKLRIAGHVVGSVGLVLPGAAEFRWMHRSAAEVCGSITELLEEWRQPVNTGSGHPYDCDDGEGPFAAAVKAPEPGFIALLRCPASTTLLANRAGVTSADAELLLESLRCAHVGAARDPSEHASALREAHASIAEWWSRQRATVALDVSATRAARTRRRIATRIAAALSLVPRHRRAQLAGAVGRAQEVVRLPLGAAAEASLATLATAPIADEQWLGEVAAFAELYGRHSRTGAELPDSAPVHPPIAAILLLVPAARAP